MVRLCIQSHGFGAELGLDGFDLTEFVGRIFMEDVNHAFTRGSEYQSRFRFISGSVNASRDRKRLNDVSVVSIHDHQHPGIAARAEESAVFLIERQGGCARHGDHHGCGFGCHHGGTRRRARGGSRSSGFRRRAVGPAKLG